MGLFKKDSREQLLSQFDTIHKQVDSNVEKQYADKMVSRPEYLLFRLLFEQARHLAVALLETKVQYFEEVVAHTDLQDTWAIDSAYLFLSTQQLHVFLTVRENKPTITDFIDTSEEKLVEKFSNCIQAGSETQKHLKNLLTKFSSLVEKESQGDPRDLWFNNAITFGEMLSKGSVQYNKDFETNLKLGMLVDEFQVTFGDFEDFFNKTLKGT